MIEGLTYNDITLIPRFSSIESRADCDTSTNLAGLKLNVPIISSNMDTVTDYTVAKLMREQGGIGCLHRFWSIESQVHQYKHSPSETIQAVGIGDKELDRALALYEAGARFFRLDVAHAANTNVVNAFNRLVERFPDAKFFVGNFADYDGYAEFLSWAARTPDALLVGVGSGAACSTRVVTGHGVPMVTALDSFKTKRYWGIEMPPIIADGGINNSGDIAKALAVGADAVMIGSLIAATEESPALNYSEPDETGRYPKVTRKQYRGSASYESYQAQGKQAAHRTPEGESMWLPVSGTLEQLITNLKAGLQSAMSYTGAKNLEDFKALAKYTTVSHASYIEGLPRNKR
jgi:IMP dehydrogenase